MIFVTVGTHEDSFDRLIKEIDRLKGEKIILEDVKIQIGYTKYLPIYCSYDRVIGFERMNKLAKEASIIITHGGPGSMLLALQYNKIPIVVPRQKKFNEHVDDHQVYFSKRMKAENRVLTVFDIECLGDIIVNYSEIVANNEVDEVSCTSNFVRRFKIIADELLI